MYTCGRLKMIFRVRVDQKAYEGIDLLIEEDLHFHIEIEEKKIEQGRIIHVYVY